LTKFNLAATGGTFDVIHAGHFALLSKAFEISDKVIIGVTSDEFAAKNRGKSKIHHNYETRVAALKEAIKNRFGKVDYTISKLHSRFGPAVVFGQVDVLVASSETVVKGKEINEIRLANGFKPLAIISVKLVKADDGRPISSTRIRLGQIDSSGKVLKQM
jgi:pantetheine-phosphate adenylyltransferase